MIARELDATERELLVRAAILAPSADEVRPWRFGVDGDTVDVNLDAGGQSDGHFAGSGSGSGSGRRRVMVGVGAALFNLRVAAAALARGTTTRLLPDPGRPELLAQVRVWPGPGTEVCLAGLLLHLYRPRPGRRSYADRPIPPAIRRELERAAATEGATLSWADDGHRERPWGPAGYGCQDGVLAGSPYQPSYEDHWTRAVLTTSATSSTANAGPRDWLVAGQALQRVLLVAARHGLSGSAFGELGGFDELGGFGGFGGFGDLGESAGWQGTFGLSHRPCTGGPAHVGLRLGWGPSITRTTTRPLADFVADDLCS
ncbi:hypothetical protein ABZV93_21745 [Actinopolymorpha sp. NPDC004070]|uniref:hypothetical protein n=1 Tax=Actinopolymorpha sp. NPDC004070 TaxID=3154548 RepID=UPI0033A06804